MTTMPSRAEREDRALRNALVADHRRAKRDREAGLLLIRRGWWRVDPEAQRRAKAVRLDPDARKDLADLLGYLDR